MYEKNSKFKNNCKIIFLITQNFVIILIFTSNRILSSYIQLLQAELKIIHMSTNPSHKKKKHRRTEIIRQSPKWRKLNLSKIYPTRNIRRNNTDASEEIFNPISNILQLDPNYDICSKLILFCALTSFFFDITKY